MFKYYIIYKPFVILSQFSDEGNRKGLGSIYDVEKDIYPVGRLDADSEGMLILTNDKSLTDRVLNPKNKFRKTYWAQVEGEATEEHMKELSRPMQLNYKGKIHTTLPAKARILDFTPELPERDPPIRFRLNVPDTWISLELTEGKNRQVRKMTAKVGLPTLRLVRYSIEGLNIDGFTSGEIREIDREAIEAGLNRSVL